MSDEAPKSLHDLAILQNFELEELLDRPALTEMTQAFEGLFRVPLRIYSSTGALLADAMAVPGLYRYLDSQKGSRTALASVINEVRRAKPPLGESTVVRCISGGEYLITSIHYEGRDLGRTVVGPFVDQAITSPPPHLLDLDSALSSEEIARLWSELPKLPSEQARRIESHLKSVLDLLVFSGLKAHLASSMHMATVHENFRELSDKNRKLQEAYDKLKELDRLKSNFLATVSHELRTPLTSIIGYSEMILEGISGEINAEQRDFVSTIHEKGEQLLSLIKSLLDLSKMESGTLSMHKGEIDPKKVVDTVVSTLTPLARKKGVNLLAEGEALPSLYADSERLRQVLLNLTENAIKFTPPSGTVTVSARVLAESSRSMGGMGGVLLGAATKSSIEFRVADTGIGIPEDERMKVFDAFYQVDSSSTREAGGTGLGLSIVKRIVDAHEGSVRIDGNEPNGTVFIVTIPIKKSHP